MTAVAHEGAPGFEGPLYRVGALALIASGILASAGFFIHPSEASAESIQSGRWVLAHGLIVASIGLGLLGLTGFYLRQAAALGYAGLAAYLLAIVGFFGNFGEVFFEAVYNPALAADAPALVSRIGDGSGLGAASVLGALSGLLLVIGYVGLGLLAIRARVFERHVGAVMIVGIIVFGLFVSEAIASPVLGIVGPLAYLAMQVVMGTALARSEPS